MKKLNEALAIRKSLIEQGAGMAVLEINEIIAKLAKKLKINYYSLK
jgi:hypothetical protein